MIDAAAMDALVASPSTIARRSWPSRSPRAKPSDRRIAPGRATSSSAARRAAMFILCRPRVSMLSTLRETTATFAATRRTTGYSASRAAWSCCLESLSARRSRTSRRVRRSRSRRTAAATIGPARQPRPASSAPATNRRPSRRSCRNRRPPVDMRRTGSEEADAVRRPVRGEGASDDPLARDGSPESAVVGSPTVVTHHEVHTGGHRDGDREVAISVRTSREAREGLLLAHAVEDDVTVVDRDPVARTRDDALDEVHAGSRRRRARAGLPVALRRAALVRLRAGRRMEHGDVADVRRAEARPDPVHEDTLADLQRGDHRLRWDAVRLHQERLDPECETQRYGDDDDKLYEGVPALSAGAPHDLLSGSSAASGSLSAAESPAASASASASASAGASLSAVSSVAALSSVASAGWASTASSTVASAATPSASTAAWASGSSAGDSVGAAAAAGWGPVYRRSRTRAALPTRSRR